MPAPSASSSGFLYSACPWRFHPDPEELGELFDGAAEMTLAAHANHAFGREPFVYLIDEGVLATYAPITHGLRMTALFTKGSVLGGPKALLHGEPMDLTVLALTPVKLRRRNAVQFRRWLADRPAVELKYLRSLALNHEAQIDGLLINGIDAVPVRLARLFPTLLEIGGASGDSSPSGGSAELPIEPTVEELGLMIHATRAVVNRVLVDWEKSGRIARTARRIRVNSLAGL